MASEQFNQIYRGKKVLITGHTGFKGSWLSIWLRQLGAQVIGYSLDPPTSPNLFTLSGLENQVQDNRGDIRDFAKLKSLLSEHQPDVIFHLAAQPIVLHSYERPHETFSTNSQGTVNLLEAAKDLPGIQAVIVITTDKCYDNREWVWGYRENDPLGGDDPYSASKAMAELAAHAYQKSFRLPIATARAGNILGGGDFSDFRIVPDTMKALLSQQPVEVRRPANVRPWLYILDALRGYLLLGQHLIQHGASFAEAWNFGPKESHAVPVRSLVEKAIAVWGEGKWIDTSSNQQNPEMQLLKLNWDKAASKLGWHPLYNWEQAICATAEWFKAYSAEKNPDMYPFCAHQIQKYQQFKENQNEVYSHTAAECLSH